MCKRLRSRPQILALRKFSKLSFELMRVLFLFAVKVADEPISAFLSAWPLGLKVALKFGILFASLIEGEGCWIAQESLPLVWYDYLSYLT